MKRNGAIWVALVVVAVAAALMYFVVLPQTGGKKAIDQIAKQAGETMDKASDTMQKTIDQVAGQAPQTADKTEIAGKAADPKAVLLQKMARIKNDGETAAAEFEALFADNKRPTAQQLAAARAKLTAAMKNASELSAPDGMDARTAALVANVAGGAKTVLQALDAMPIDADSAVKRFVSMKKAMLAALDGQPAPAGDAVAPDVTKADNAKNATPPVDQAKTSDTSLPSFDVLRVEKDGSTVIAGKAQPGAKVDILDGDAVVASTDTGAAADFVAVLDNPLKSGDHQLVIRVTGTDGKQVVSAEVATVSVPADKSGQLLAMVTRPGEASRIMEMPGAETEAGKQTVVAQNNANKAADTTSTTTEAKTEPGATAKPADTAKSVDTAKVEPAKPAAEATETKGAASNDTGKAETVAADTAKPAEAAKAESESKPAVDTAKATDVTETKDAAKAATPDETADADTTKLAANEAKAVSADTSTPADKAATPEVLVNAVEIEGDKIFVAGSARPRSVVRVYADDKLVAEVATDPNGRFVADNRLPLSVGSHTIRADVLSGDGKRVEFRASVPFFRPEGEQLAAVNGDAVPADAKVADASAMQPLADGEYDKAREEAGKAVALLKGLYVSGRTPTLDELAAARSATEIALKTLSQIKVGADENPMAKEMADKTAGKAAEALALLKSLPQDPNAVKTALNSIDAAVTSAVAPAMEVAASKKTAAAAKENSDQAVAPVKPATSEQAEAAKSEQTVQAADTASSEEKQAADQKASTSTKPVDQEQPKQATQVAAVDQNQPKVIEQAPLKPSASASVIIRRGDTLWQISRRVYGLGVRYTTIYLANQDQITNPDRIMPGQIFGVPEKYLPNSEELHRERIEHRK